jgi:conjugative relaxase-like TrwC/TraI family protein
MVASVGALTSAGQAASYYEADDYYAEGGLAPSEWAGAGADDLDLSGEVDRNAFRALLDGQVEGRQLGTPRDGKIDHRPGWDVTLSAPKSVSVMAQVAGDRRLIGAHGKAVKVALTHIESQMAATRVREDGGVSRVTTDKLVIASFQHGTSRAQDPQLHTHNVILNMTKGADGVWRSLEPRAMFQLQKQIGAIYRQELAREVRVLGYDIAVAKDSMFEIAGVPALTLDAFSSRSADIEAALEARGQTRETASAAEKQIAALDTRDAKESVDHRKLTAEWRAVADANVFDREARAALVARAESEAATANLGELGRAAAQSVSRAIASLEERQSVFSESALREEAGRIGMGRVGYVEIGREIANAVETGALEPRTYLDQRGAEFKGFASRANIEIERTMLNLELAGRGAVAPLASQLDAHRSVARIAGKAGRTGHAWNDEQRSATVAILTSRNRVIGLQGYAGTAKTSTVLSAVAKEASARGYSVSALAPTAAAAMVLGDALDARADTVARHSLTADRAGGRGGFWIVDEASLLSSRDTDKLLKLADERSARVLLVGDTRQLGSVDAGAAFAQLQNAGMTTPRLTTIVRQTDAHAQSAVAATLEGDARRALTFIETGKGSIVEHAEGTARFKMIAASYAALSESERRRTLVIEPSRDGRDALTTEIREALSGNSALRGPKLEAQALVGKSLTREETKDARSYERGDTIVFRRGYDAKGIAKGEALTVAGVDTAKGAVSLSDGAGRVIDWRPRQWGGANVQAFESKPLELQAGDKVQFTRNDRTAGRVNGQRAEVVSVDPARNTAQLKSGGQAQTLNLDTAQDRHIRHAYVETAFGAQGSTADRVLIHADSKATNLIDQRSFYVAVSRAREAVTIFTNDRAKLITAIGERAGATQFALHPNGATILSVKPARIGLGR